jgi:uncharacterized protein YfdQ (DUF2303 family)
VTTIDNVQAIIDCAYDAAGPAPLAATERFHVVSTPSGGTSKVIDLEQERERFAETPRRKKGTYNVLDADSFVAYLFKHGDNDSEVWADDTKATVVGVLDANTDGSGPRWEQHAVAYQAKKTDAWKAWLAADGKLGSQSDFAELIEDRAIDIVEPAAADMLELAQTFQATIGVNFESSKRLSSGERQLEYRETVDAKAGKAGQLDIPEKFILGVRPFEGADAFKVIARLRYRIVDGALRIGYKLERPEDVEREAFSGVLADIQAQLSGDDAVVKAPIFRGTRATS